MSYVHVVPVLLSTLMGLLLSLVTWGFLRVRNQEAGDTPMRSRDDVLLGLLMLAAFALGVFVTYLLLSTHF